MVQTTIMSILGGFFCCCRFTDNKENVSRPRGCPWWLEGGAGKTRTTCAGAGAQSSGCTGAFPSRALPRRCCCLCPSCPSGQGLGWLENLGPPRPSPRPGPGAWVGLSSEAQSSSCFEGMDHRKQLFRLLSFLTVLVLALYSEL